MNDFFEDVLDKIAYIPGIVFAFFLIFIVHELGHYWAARLRKMRVETFSVGIGKRFYSIKDRHGTEWIFRYFPLGGHVEITDLTLDEGTKSRRSVGTRLFVVLAGPGANLLLPFFILPICFMLIGYPIRPPIVSAVQNGLPAQEAGVQNADIITHVNGQKILSYDDLGDLIENSEGNVLNLSISREDQDLIIPVKPKYKIYEDLTGIEREHYIIGVLNALLPLSFKFLREVNGEDVEDMDSDLLRAKLKSLLDQEIEIGVKGVDDKTHYYDVVIASDLNDHFNDPDHRYNKAFFLGPIKGNKFTSLDSFEYIKRGTNEAATLLWHIIQVPFQIFPIDPKIYAERVPFFPDSEYYYESLIYRAAFQTALLSILIGFINLLPFPRLDGDFVLTYAMESVLKKKPSRKQRAIAIGLSLFSIYCVFLFSNLGDLPGYLEMKMEDLQERVKSFNE